MLEEMMHEIEQNNIQEQLDDFFGRFILDNWEMLWRAQQAGYKRFGRGYVRLSIGDAMRELLHRGEDTGIADTEFHYVPSTAEQNLRLDWNIKLRGLQAYDPAIDLCVEFVIDEHYFFMVADRQSLTEAMEGVCGHHLPQLPCKQHVH